MAVETDTGAAPEKGVGFAEVDGKRSSTRAGKAIFSDAVSGVDGELAHRIATTKDWRKGYLTPVRTVVERGIASPKEALRIATDGLAAVRQHLVYVDDDDIPLGEAFRSPGGAPLHTVTVDGEGAAEHELTVPYKGDELRGEALLGRIDGWLDAGVLEPSAAEALQAVVRNPEWLDLSDRTFVLLGASSQMGPLEMLSKWRANIVAVDLPRANLWETILKLVHRGAGRAYVPSASPISDSEITEGAGVDLLVDGPRVARWISGFDGPITIGNYVYADGARFVRLAGAVDALIAAVSESRDDVSLSYLATPTDVFAVHEEVVEGARSTRRLSMARRMIRPATMGKTFVRNYEDTFSSEDGRTWGVADSLVPIQGPNYALAKSLQRWRAVAAREEGMVSSANVAPSTRTMSVLKNRMLAAAYRGAGAFGVEIFEPPTSRALMAALAVHDIRNPDAAAHPNAPLGHPFDLFCDGAVHGGLWRLGYEPRSILPLALMLGLTKRH